MDDFYNDVAEFFAQPLSYLLLAVYFAPTIMAVLKRSAGWPCCLWVNLFFGWTLIGWVICLFLGALPTTEQLAYKDKVRRARDDFYLREQEKARSV